MLHEAALPALGLLRRRWVLLHHRLAQCRDVSLYLCWLLRKPFTNDVLEGIARGAGSWQATGARSQRRA